MAPLCSPVEPVRARRRRRRRRRRRSADAKTRLLFSRQQNFYNRDKQKYDRNRIVTKQKNCSK